MGENIPHGGAIYTRSFETDLKDLTAAYTVFPNAGVRKQAYLIERIEDPDHIPIYRAAQVTMPAPDPGAAWMTTELMEEVLTHGTAAGARSLGFKLPAAGSLDASDDASSATLSGRAAPTDGRTATGHGLFDLKRDRDQRLRRRRYSLRCRSAGESNPGRLLPSAGR